MAIKLPPYVEFAFRGIRQYGLIKFFTYLKNFILIKIGQEFQWAVAAPLSVDIALTYTCNLKCSFCDLPERGQHLLKDSEKKLLSKDQILKLIADAKSIGAGAVSLTGGEPLTHPHLTEFIEAIAQHKMVSHITTAGWFLSDDVCRQLVAAGLDGITISVHGASAATHNQVVGKSGSFERLLSGIASLQKLTHKNPMQISINSVIHSENFEEIPAIFELAEALKVKQVTFNPVHKVGALNGPQLLNTHEAVNPKEKLENLIAVLLSKKRGSAIQTNSRAYFKILKDFFLKKPFPVACVAGHASLTIDSFGDYFACFPHFEDKKSFGNVHQTPLKEYWNGNNIKPLRAEAKNCRDCYWNCQSEVNLLFDHSFAPWRSL